MLAVVVALAVLPGVAAADTDAVCNDPTNQTVGNNTTVYDMCQRFGNLTEDNAELRRKVTTLQDDKTELEGRIERIRFQLNESKEKVNVNDQARQFGAWHPDVKKDHIATLVLRVQSPGSGSASEKFGLFQYVGPGNGGYDFNNDGNKAWTEVDIQQAGDTALGPIRIRLEYALPGMNRTYEFSQSQAQAEIRQLEDRMNTPEGYMAWTRWNNQKRNQVEQLNTGSYIGTVVIIGLLGVLGVIAEARTGNVRRWLNKRRRDKAVDSTYRELMESDGTDDTGLLERFR
jgi:hypothetical protein